MDSESPTALCQCDLGSYLWKRSEQINCSMNSESPTLKCFLYAWWWSSKHIRLCSSFCIYIFFSYEKKGTILLALLHLGTPEHPSFNSIKYVPRVLIKPSVDQIRQCNNTCTEGYCWVQEKTSHKCDIQFTSQCYSRQCIFLYHRTSILLVFSSHSYTL